MTTQQQIEGFLYSLNESNIEHIIRELRQSDYFDSCDLADSALSATLALLNNPRLDGYSTYDKVITGLFHRLGKVSKEDWVSECKTEGMRSVRILRENLGLHVSEVVEWAIRGYHISPIDKTNLLWSALYRIHRNEPPSVDHYEDRERVLQSVEWLPVRLEKESPQNLIVKDGDVEKDIPLFDFQQTPEYRNHLSRTFPCYRNEDGSLSQALYPLFCQVFLTSRQHTFVILDKKEDRCRLQDMYGFEHLYKGARTLEGPEVDMVVDGVIPLPNNKAELALTPARTSITLVTGEGVHELPHAITETSVDKDRKARRDLERIDRSLFYEDEPYLSIKESKTIELKSSFAYNYESEVDLDSQMAELVQVIAAFMNADGGKLYIGVKDNGVVKGIDDEFQYLSDPRYNKFVFRPNKDGFLQRIQSDIKYHLGQEALEYIDNIKFVTKWERTYAVVKVKKANQLIWYGENGLKDKEYKLLFARKFARNECYRGGRAMEVFMMNRYREIEDMNQRRYNSFT